MEIYHREHDLLYNYVEDENGNLYRWLLGTERIFPVPYEPREGLETFTPVLRELTAKSLRAFGHTVE